MLASARSRLPALLAGLGSAAILGACGWQTASRQVDCETFKFDVTAWRQGDTEVDDGTVEVTPRHRTADGLAQCDTLVGLPRRKVHRMLGPVAEGDHAEELYVVGMERNPLGMDSEFLAVAYGTDGKVIRAEVTAP